MLLKGVCKECTYVLGTVSECTYVLGTVSAILRRKCVFCVYAGERFIQNQCDIGWYQNSIGRLTLIKIMALQHKTELIAPALVYHVR